jgi:hypothetical protein
METTIQICKPKTVAFKQSCSYQAKEIQISQIWREAWRSLTKGTDQTEERIQRKREIYAVFEHVDHQNQGVPNSKGHKVSEGKEQTKVEADANAQQIHQKQQEPQLIQRQTKRTPYQQGITPKPHQGQSEFLQQDACCPDSEQRHLLKP